MSADLKDKAKAKDDASSLAEPKNDAEPYPAWLAAGWQQRDKWLQDRTFVLAPMVFRQLEAGLLRAEEQWRGGTPLDKVKDRLTQGLREWTSEAAKLRAAWPRPTPTG